MVFARWMALVMIAIWPCATVRAEDIPGGGILLLNKDKQGSGGMEFSPDSKLLACSVPGRIDLWDLHDLKVVGSLEALERPSFNLRFSPNGKYLGSGGNDKTTRIWSVADRKLVHTLVSEEQNQSVRALGFSEDGQEFFTSSYHVRVWDVESGKLKRTFHDLGSYIGRAALSPSGKWVVTDTRPPGSWPVVRVWDAQTGAPIAHLRYGAHEFPSGWIGFSSDSSHIFNADRSSHGTGLLCFDVHGKSKEPLAVGSAPISSFAFSSRDRLLVYAERVDPESHVVVYDVNAKRVLRRFGPFTQYVYVTISPDGRYVAGLRTENQVWLPVIVWDLEGGDSQKQIEPPNRGQGEQPPPGLSEAQPEQHTATTFSANSRWLASAKGESIMLRESSLRGAPDFLTLPDQQFCMVHFSPDSKYLAAGSEQGIVTLWTVADHKLQRTFKPNDGESPFQAVGFVAGGKELVTTCGSDIRTWDVETGERKRTIQNTDGPISRAVVSGNGKWLAMLTTSADIPAMQIWNFAADTSIKVRPDAQQGIGKGDLHFSPDSGRLVRINKEGDGLLAFSVLNGQLKDRIALRAEGIEAFGMSDNKIIVCVERHGDGKCYVMAYDIAMGRKRQHSRLTEPGYMAIAISPNGRVISGVPLGHVTYNW